MSKRSVTTRGLRVVTTCWSWAWLNRTFPSKWVGLGSPLAACSVYRDLTCTAIVNNLCMFNCQCHFYLWNRGPYVRLAFVPNMISSWNKDSIIIIILSFKIKPLCSAFFPPFCIFSKIHERRRWCFRFLCNIFAFLDILHPYLSYWYRVLQTGSPVIFYVV